MSHLISLDATSNQAVASIDDEDGGTFPVDYELLDTYFDEDGDPIVSVVCADDHGETVFEAVADLAGGRTRFECPLYQITIELDAS